MEPTAPQETPARRDPELVSVVAPAYNEAETIAEFCARVAAALDGFVYELVIVDDGSSDATAQILASLAPELPQLRVLSLSRNFGHQAAITAGLDSARGDVTVMLDADLQDPPELIPEMIERWRQGGEVVAAVRRSRSGESRFKLTTARWFYRLFSRLAQIDLTPQSGDFRLLDRAALDALLAMPERSRFLRGMSVWVGFNRDEVAYDRDERFAGETKYTLRKMLRFSFDALVSFSQAPLQFAMVLGFLCSLIAFLGIPIAIAFRIAGEFVPGITTVLFVVLLLGGVQLITVGIIGEYLGRIYEEVKARPLYILRKDGEEPHERRRSS